MEVKPNPVFEKWAKEDLENFVKFVFLLLEALEAYKNYLKK